MKKRFTSLSTALIVLFLMLFSLPKTGWANQDQVTSQTATNNGQYVIAIYYNGDYYALPKASDITSSGTHSGVKVTLNAAGKVSTSDAADITWKLVVNSDNSNQFYIQQTIGNKTYYLYKNGTSGGSNYNISAVQTGQHYWTFSQQSNTYSTYTVKSERGSANLYLTNTSNTSTFSVRSSTNSYITLLAVGDAFNVTYNPGTGSGTPLVDNNGGGGYANNATVTVKANAGDGNPNFSKTGHTFGGWFMSQACTGTEYGPGENQTHTFSITANTTLYAKWIPDTYNITYKAGFGEQPDIVETKTYGVNYTIADNAFDAPSGSHTFIGWKDASSNDWAPGDTYTGNAALTLTAQWTTATMYTVSYDCNGGESGCPSNAIIENGTQINLPAAPTYSNYTFNGWMCDADLETYAAGASYTVESNVGFEAQWLDNLANPTFSVTGVSNGTANTYYVTVNITIEQEDGADVYYTTDNSDPTILSTKYTAAFSVTESCTIKAIAIENGYANSQIVSQQISIVQPNEATFTSGIYNDLTSGFGGFYTYNVTGNQVWTWTSYSNTQCAYMNGYDNGRKENEDWLISPKLVAENGKLNISFQSLRTYSGGTFTAKYSTNYNGYGAPSTATWNNLDVTMATSSSWTNSGNVTVNGTNIHIAIVYTSTTESAGAYYIKNFTAKQCYPITYYAHGGTGTTADANSPYAVGTEVTILDNGFTAPAGKEFTSWNTVEGGTGETKSPGQKITMTTAGYELYAQWGDACVLKATMSATTGEAVYDYNSGNKRFNINLESSVDEHGGCDIFDYGFVYSTSVTTPTVGADNCTKVQVGDSQPDEDDPFETTLTNVTKEATYYLSSYATNAAGTAYSDVISVTVPDDFPTWTISYTTNGEDESTTTSIFKGAPISGLLAAPEQDVPSGYTFMGWYGSDYALNNEAPTFVKNGDAINSNLTLKAVFAISTVTGEGTAELTNTTIKDNRTGKTSYGDYSIGDWSGKFMIAKNGEVYGLQLGYNSSSSASAYNSHLTTPECDYNITSITINTNNGTASGRTFFLCNASNLGTASSTNATYGYGSTSSANGSVTINVNGNTKQFHIYPNGTAYIASVSFAYRNVSYSSYCTSVSPQTAISGTISEGHLTTDGTIETSTAVYLTTPITINSGVKLTVNGALGNDNPANLIIEDGGQLICNNAVQATVQKNVTAYSSATGLGNTDGWHFIALPINSDEFTPTEAMLTGTYDLYRLDPTSNKWQNYKPSGDNENPNAAAGFKLENGRGYLYANDNGFTVDFAGEVKAAAATQDVTVYQGWNLIGNPFTYNVYVNRPYYKMNDAKKGVEIVESYTTNTIAPCTGVVVTATEASETVTFSKEAPVSSANHGNIQMTLAQTVATRGESHTETIDNAIVSFNEGTELEKFYFGTQNANIYIPLDNEEYAIVSSNAQGEMPVNFKASQDGQYTITVNSEGVEVGYLHLIDNIAGKDIDLLATPSYTFNAKGDDYESRFRLVFSANMTNAEMGEDFAFFSNGQLVIANEGEATLQVIDVTGRVVANENINGTCSKAISAKAGVYVLRLINGTDVKTQKMVIR